MHLVKDTDREMMLTTSGIVILMAMKQWILFPTSPSLTKFSITLLFHLLFIYYQVSFSPCSKYISHLLSSLYTQPHMSQNSFSPVPFPSLLSVFNSFLIFSHLSHLSHLLTVTPSTHSIPLPKPHLYFPPLRPSLLFLLYLTLVTS